MEILFLLLFGGAVVVAYYFFVAGAKENDAPSSKSVRLLSPIERAYDYKQRLEKIDDEQVQSAIAGAIYEFAAARMKWPDIEIWLKDSKAEGANAGLLLVAREMEEELNKRQLSGDLISAAHLMPILFAVCGIYDEKFRYVAMEIWNRLVIVRDPQKVAEAIGRLSQYRNVDEGVKFSILDLHFSPLALWDSAKVD